MTSEASELDQNQNYVKYFILFNLALLLLVGGLLGYLRFTGDPFQPAPHDHLNYGMVGAAWFISLIMFILFVVRDHQATRLQNAGGALFFLALAEVALLGWMTMVVFTTSRQSLHNYQTAGLITTIKQMRDQFPLKLDPHLSLTDVSFGPGSLMYKYAADAEFKSSQEWDANVKQAQLTKLACPLFYKYFTAHVLVTLYYSFEVEGDTKTIITVPLSDCVQTNNGTQ